MSQVHTPGKLSGHDCAKMKLDFNRDCVIMWSNLLSEHYCILSYSVLFVEESLWQADPHLSSWYVYSSSESIVLARFSPDDKFSKERVAMKKRCGILYTKPVKY